MSAKAPPPYPVKRMCLKDIDDVGHLLTIAWIHDLKWRGDELFLTLRDGTAVKEFKVVKGRELLKNLPCESIVQVKGHVKKDELKIEELKVIVKAPGKMPIDIRNPAPEDVERFTKYSYLVLRSPRYAKMLVVQQWLVYYAREFLIGRGFIEALPPMISPCSDPGLRGAKKLRTRLYGYEYELMSSVIMFKQALASSLERIFFVARNVREEPADNLKTGRHLCEFTQIDIEWAFASMWDVMKLAEEMLKYTIEKVMDRCKSIIEEFNPDLKAPSPPFKVLTYEEAVELLRDHGVETPKGKELTQEGERVLSSMFDEPIWITHYPKTSRGFYYIEAPEAPGHNRDFNLLLPKGYGEVIDGGEREYRLDKIIERLKLMGEDPTRYSWFLDLARIGIPPSAGFGLGVERLTRYVLGLKYIWEAVPFPKVPGIAPTP